METKEEKFDFSPTPMQQGVLSAIQAFTAFESTMIQSMARSYQEVRNTKCLEFRLPRQQGSTLLCHALAHSWGCPVVTKNLDTTDSFSNEHMRMYGDHPLVLSPMHLKEFCSFRNGLVNDRNEFYAAATKSKLILFDIFRAYCDNSTIKKLIEEMGYCRFIMFQ